MEVEVMNMNPVVHFEMPAEDKKRMAAFYTRVFGWQANFMGPEMGEYVVVSTSESDPQTGRPKNPGSINGGFYQKSGDAACPSIVIAVDDIHASMKSIAEAGGKVQGEPVGIPGVGEYISFIDTEGNRVGVLQPKM
jgi:predicted enzyme related to lactoylglutathione lyase